MRREGSFRKTHKQRLDGSIHAGRSLAGRHDGALLAYERMLGHVQSVTTLLRTSARPRDCHTALNAGLHALALHHADWLRPVETWFPTPQMDGGIGVFTPAVGGTDVVDQLQPQSAPALGNRALAARQIDEPLLRAILARWEHCFAAGKETVENRRLFRALEMARAASRTPGGSDASV